jgi:hypothetical protein
MENEQAKEPLTAIRPSRIGWQRWIAWPMPLGIDVVFEGLGVWWEENGGERAFVGYHAHWEADSGRGVGLGSH